MAHPLVTLVFFATFCQTGFAADYNVTCPDYRFCEVKHKYQSPCPFWDCSPCWWHFANCSKTDEAPSYNCPYVTCQNLPQPGHGSTVTAIVSTVAVFFFLAMFVAFLYRRLRSTQAEVDLEDEAQGERVPLLDRYRTFFQTSQTASAAALERFRSVIFGNRASTASPEVPRVSPEEDEDQEDQGYPQEERQPENPHAPSAPPPPYAAEDPIIRSYSRSLVNESFAARSDHTGHSSSARTSPNRQTRDTEMVVLREHDTPRDRRTRCMEEIPLSKSLS